jgi:glutamate synthase (NADPH/NADH) small chain
MKGHAVKAEEISVDERLNGFTEVTRGYSEKDALLEASRCLQCKNPACSAGCPVGIDIKKFIYISGRRITVGIPDDQGKNNPFLCGRVCPAEYRAASLRAYQMARLLLPEEESISIS